MMLFNQLHIVSFAVAVIAQQAFSNSDETDRFGARVDIESSTHRTRANTNGLSVPMSLSLDSLTFSSLPPLAFRESNDENFGERSPPESSKQSVPFPGTSTSSQNIGDNERVKAGDGMAVSRAAIAFGPEGIRCFLLYPYRNHQSSPDLSSPNRSPVGPEMNERGKEMLDFTSTIFTRSAPFELSNQFRNPTSKPHGLFCYIHPYSKSDLTSLGRWRYSIVTVLLEYIHPKDTPSQDNRKPESQTRVGGFGLAMLDISSGSIRHEFKSSVSLNGIEAIRGVRRATVLEEMNFGSDDIRNESGQTICYLETDNADKDDADQNSDWDWDELRSDSWDWEEDDDNNENMKPQEPLTNFSYNNPLLRPVHEVRAIICSRE